MLQQHPASDNIIQTEGANNVQISFHFSHRFSAVGWELDAIAAVVIGGTLLTGGQGGTTSTLVGVLLLGVILNALTQENVSWYWQPLFRGVILLAVVIAQRVLSRR